MGNKIERLEINNFHNFRNFKLENLGRFNVITGPNNVGKTSLLEAIFSNGALFVDKREEKIRLFIYSIIQIALFRRMGFLSELKGKTLERIKSHLLPEKGNILINGKSLTNFPRVEKLEEKLLNWLLKLQITPEALIYEIENPPVVFIPSCFQRELFLKCYDQILEKGEEEKLFEQIRAFYPEMKKLLVTPFKRETIVVTRGGERVEISYLGEGFKRALLFLVTLYWGRGKVLLIDEVENGIWYRLFPELIQTLYDLAEKLEVQLFLTTHSRDFLEGVYRFLKEREGKEPEIRIIELMGGKDGTYPHIYTPSQFRVQWEAGEDVRGW